VAVVVHDVNTRLFAGSDQDSRTGILNQGRARTVVIGARTAELALDGWRKSRALQADTQHYYRIVCGADTATGSFRTPSVPLGQLYNDPIPPDTVHPGDTAWPDFDWNTTGTSLYSNSQYTVVDPHTGALARMLSVPRWNDLTIVAPGYAVDRGGGTGAWSNPSYALVDDASSATYTGDGASSSQPWLAIFPAQWADYGKVYGTTDDYRNSYEIKFTLKGSSTGGAGATSTVEYCFSIDGGETCQSAIKEQDLTACGSGCFLGNDEPLFRFWQDPTDRTKVLQPKWNLTGRVGAADYVASTKVVRWVSGGFFNPLWAAGSRFTFTGGSEPGEYVIASVDSAKQITLSTGPTGNQTGAAFAAQNFALMIRKKTNSAVTVGVDYLATAYGNTSSQIHGSAGGDSGFCSLSKVARASDGKLGYHCTFGPAMTYHWVDPDTGDATFLGKAFAPVAGYGNATLSAVGFDPSDPNTIWGTANGTAGTGLMAFVYNGNHEDFGWVNSNNLYSNFPVTVYGEINAAVAAYFAADPTGPQFGGRMCGGSQNYWQVAPGAAYTVVQCSYGGYNVQDYSPMVALIDFEASRTAGSVQVIGAVSPHGYYPLRYMAIHSVGVVAAPLFPYVGGQTTMVGSSVCSAGPLQTEIATGPSLPATATDSCPANPYGTTGECANPAGCSSGCSTVAIRGEPYDPSPCQWWGRITDPVSLSTLTGIVVSGGTATVNTTSGQVAVGKSARVSGTGVTNLDGDYTVATSGANTFTFATAAADGTYAVPGAWVAELWGSPASVIETPFRGSAGVWGTFQNAAPGDMFRVPGATGSELVQILEKTDSTHWKVLRNVSCSRLANAWALKLESHSAGAMLTGQGVHVCISEDSWAWDVTNDPRGQNFSSYSKAIGRHGGYNTFRDGALFENSNRLTYDFFDGISTIAAKITAGADFGVSFAPKFAGKSGNMGTWTRTLHPAWPADASYGVDVQAWYLGAQGSPPTTFSRVTGTLYSALASGQNALDRKHFPTLATCGHHPLADVSGASSTITGNYTDRYKYCVVNASGECVAGSNPTVANVYINCPEISQTTCVSAEDDADSNLLTDPCIYDLPPNVSHVSIIHRPAESYDPKSEWIQNLGHKFSRWRKQSGYASARITPGGELAYTVTRYLEGVRSEAIAYKIPATPARSSTNRATFAALPRQVGSVPAGTDNVAAEFGYDANLYCTTRQEVCVSVTGGATPQPVNETTPFYWSGESYSGVPCSTGCTLTIPAVPQRVVYYRFKYRTASGATLATSATEVVVSP
jgi:hypothetical protein